MIIVPFTTIWWNLKNAMLIKWLREEEYTIECLYSQVMVISEIRGILRIENQIKSQNCNSNMRVDTPERYQQKMQM